MPIVPIRVRFAPSPTGELHVGGARTAVFNWLFAKANKGKFLLRIEDTDRERSSEELTRRIQEGLIWLGLKWDEEPYYQYPNADKHVANAIRLLENRKAYRCFCSQEKLQNERTEALKSGQRSWKYPGYCRDLDDDEIKTKLVSGLNFSVRFKILEGLTGFDDLIHGNTTFENKNIEDFILLRSDGSPTYQLAVVSDDIEMNITHVIRGDDHISNTPKQIMLYQALSWRIPRFGHIPLILGTDKKRLSKRHGATSLLEYRDKGYLPEAMLNFLSLLGWSPGTNEEFLPMDRLISVFSIDGINKSSAVFDEKKLEWLNSRYISSSTADSLYPFIMKAFKQEGLWQDDFQSTRKEWFYNLIDLLKTRCKVIPDFPRDAYAYINDDFEYDRNGIEKYLKEDTLKTHLAILLDRYNKTTEFTAENLENILRALVGEAGKKAAYLIHPLRLALLGVTVSPGVFDVAIMLGKEKVLSRVERLINWLDNNQG